MNWFRRWKDRRLEDTRRGEQLAQWVAENPSGGYINTNAPPLTPEEKERDEVRYRKLSYAMDKSLEGGPYPPGHVHQLGNLDDIEDPGEEYMEERKRKQRAAENNPG